MTGIDEATGIDRGKGLPPGGANFANLQAVGEIAAAIIEKATKHGSTNVNIAPDQDILKETANELAPHTLQDPSNPVLLQNLVVFFDAIQDKERASLARDLAADLIKVH